MLKRLISIIITLFLIINIFTVCNIDAFAGISYEQKAKKLEKTVYSGELGAIYSKKSTTFKVWSPKAQSVKVRIYKFGSDNEGSIGYLEQKPMKLDKSTGVWKVNVKGDFKDFYYTYFVEHGKKSFETSDIYAKACGVNGERSMIVDLNSTDPKGWENDKYVTVDNSTDAKIWEIQIADFSHSESSGVSKENRGKYLAFTENGTTVNSIKGGQPTCVDYLKELGVNYVHINPFYDFGSIDETDKSDNDNNYNWGYDPVNYNCPEGSYSSNPYKGDVRIRECKEMIMALHNAGIGVIMDVVYNHTQKGEDSNFNKTVPDYYYRINNDGSWSNGSGCGNDTASERTMFSKYMVDSVTYWAKEYHIDGFRFDLMGLHDVDTMNNIRKALDKLENGTKILMYGEPWQLTTTADSDCQLSNQGNMYLLSDRIAAFDDTFRDSLKGSTSGNDCGFIQNGSRIPGMKQGLEGQSDSVIGWASAPTQCVTYGSCHDNLTMWDKLVKSIKGNDANFLKRHNDLVAMNKLAGAITYTSQGISFMLAGEEFCRTKSGDENSYSSGFKVNEINWENLYTFGDVSDYYKGLIEIRNNISAFRDPTPDTAQSIEYLENLPEGVIAYTVKDKLFNDVCVIFNGSDSDVVVKTKGNWIKLADENTAGMNSLGTVNDEAKVKGSSAVILVDKNSYEDSGVKPEQGKVIVRYFEHNKLFKSYVINGNIGEKYEISPLQSVSMDYDITKKIGIKGTFGSSVQYCDFYCNKFEGNVSSVTFMFLDSKTDKNIAESVVMTSRQGEKYQTISIPAIKGYELNVRKLPENGCGLFGAKDIVVKYYYDKSGKFDGTCLVNIIYMSTDGTILGVNEKTGAINENYTTQQIEFPDYKLVNMTDNANGVFTEASQNILFVYSPITFTTSMMYLLLIILAVSAILIFTFVNFRKKKAKLMRELDIS